MYDTIVTAKTARLAREKGFNIPVLNCYNENDELGDIDDLIFINYNKFPVIKGSNTNMYSAPTQESLVKWLRETHNIQVFAFSNTIGLGDKYRDYVVYMNNRALNDPRDEQFQTYEAAIEFGLQQVLTNL